MSPLTQHLTHPDHQRLGLEADRGRDPEVGFKGLANNTTVRRLDPDDPDSPVAIRLHQTDIITVTHDGHVTLNSGGWQTVTTKARMNEFAPGLRRLSQVQHIWYVTLRATPEVEHDYVEGFTYDIDSGEILHNVDEASEAVEERERLRDAIRKYAREFPIVEAAQRLVNGETRGDCFPCQFRSTDPEEFTAEPMGVEHLHMHLAEDYHVPSLLLNAYRHRYSHERAQQARVAESMVVRLARDGGGRHNEKYARKLIRGYLKAHLFDGQGEVA